MSVPAKLETTTETRRAEPRWLLPAAAGVGGLAAIALPYGPPGIGVTLVAAALVTSVLPVARRGPRSAVFAAIACALVLVALFRDAGWLVTVALTGALAFAGLAASGMGRTWFGLIDGVAAVPRTLAYAPWALGRPIRRATGTRSVRPVVIGVAITAVLVAGFGALLASADAVFSSYAGRILSAPDWGVSAPLRITVFVVFALLAAAFVLTALRPRSEPAEPWLRLRAARAIWALPLTALNLLFAAFVAVQVTVLFGGNRQVLETAGLTYAEYARSGFFQLAWVSAFVLGIVAFAGGGLALTGADRWLMGTQLGVLCGLTLVILASALQRLHLYIDAYGHSRLRATVMWSIWWLAAIFALVLIAGFVRLARRRETPWLPATIAAATGAGLVAFAAWSPDLRIAEAQLTQRALEERDVEYLSGLSADAVPALARLPEPTRSCVLYAVMRRHGLDRPDPWNGWNLAREQAREVIAENQPRPPAACPSVR